MYDPKIGQFLSEDPIDFEGLDENLRRYVHNRVVTHIDPNGLQEQIAAQQSMPSITVPVVIIDLSTHPKAGTFSDDILQRANEILAQCNVFLSKVSMVFAPHGDDSRIIFDARTDKFKGGGWTGKSLKDVLKEMSERKNAIHIILVDEIIGERGFTFGESYVPGNPNGEAIVLAINQKDKKKENPDHGWTLAHECANYAGVKDSDRSGNTADSLMSYGKWGPDNKLIRGTALSAEQIRQIRSSLGEISRGRESR